MFTGVKFLRWQGQTVNNCNVNIWCWYIMELLFAISNNRVAGDYGHK